MVHCDGELATAGTTVAADTVDAADTEPVVAAVVVAAADYIVESGTHVSVLA